jgi:hypothetical protein
MPRDSEEIPHWLLGLRGVINRLGMIFCWHDLLVQRDGRRLYVICTKCQYESPGIKIEREQL